MPNACPPDSQDWRIGGFTDSWKLSSTGFSVQEARPGPALSIIVLWPRARCCGVVGAGLRCDRGKVEIFRSVGLGLEISLNFGARWAFRLRARTPGDPGHPARACVHTRARPPPTGVRARARTRAGLENPGKNILCSACVRATLVERARSVSALGSGVTGRTFLVFRRSAVRKRPRLLILVH